MGSQRSRSPSTFSTTSTTSTASSPFLSGHSAPSLRSLAAALRASRPCLVTPVRPLPDGDLLAPPSPQQRHHDLFASLDSSIGEGGGPPVAMGGQLRFDTSGTLQQALLYQAVHRMPSADPLA